MNHSTLKRPAVWPDRNVPFDVHCQCLMNGVKCNCVVCDSEHKEKMDDLTIAAREGRALWWFDWDVKDELLVVIAPTAETAEALLGRNGDRVGSMLTIENVDIVFPDQIRYYEDLPEMKNKPVTIAAGKLTGKKNASLKLIKDALEQLNGSSLVALQACIAGFQINIKKI